MKTAMKITNKKHHRQKTTKNAMRWLPILITIVISLLLTACVTGGTHDADAQGDYGGDYFSFVLIGLAFLNLRGSFS